jgi:hypothetical protein
MSDYAHLQSAYHDLLAKFEALEHKLAELVGMAPAPTPVPPPAPMPAPPPAPHTPAPAVEEPAPAPVKPIVH